MPPSLTPDKRGGHPERLWACSKVSLAKVPGFGMRSITQGHFLEEQMLQAACVLDSPASRQAAAAMQLRRGIGIPNICPEPQDHKANDKRLIVSASWPKVDRTELRLAICLKDASGCPGLWT